MQQIRWVWSHMKGLRFKYIFGIVLGLIAISMTLINPTISGALVDRVVVGTALDNGEVLRRMDLLIPLCLAMIGNMLVRTGLLYMMLAFVEQASKGTDMNLRNSMFQKLMACGPSFYQSFRSGDIMTRMTGDLEFVRYAFNFVLRQLLTSGVLFLATTVYFLVINVKFTLCLLAVSPILAVASFVYFRKAKPLFITLREKLADLNTAAQENIAGNRVIKAFASEGYESYKFAGINGAYREQNMKVTRFWLKFFPLLDILGNSLTVTTLLVGGIFVIRGEMTYGNLIAVSSMSWALSEPMKTMGMLLNDLQRFFASAAKIMELYNTVPEIREIENAVDIGWDDFKGDIEFDGVTFGFGPVAVLSDVSFKVPAGSTIGVMGVTGSGKTSVVNLITRLYDVKNGCVRIDGVDVRQWDLKSLRSKISVATQDVFLFSDTAEGNIAYGNQKLTMDEIKRLAKLACAMFIPKLSQGYDTIIGERGVGLSGGQRQRIALARALAMKPKILILDDVTSAVDNETEAMIQANLKLLDYPCTRVIVAQRVSSVREADKIIVLDGGKIAESGTHAELMARGGVYREIYDIQYGIPPESGFGISGAPDPVARQGRGWDDGKEYV